MLIGIDPGISGAVGILCDDGTFMEVHDIPNRPVPGSGRIRREIDIFMLNRIMEDIRRRHDGKKWRICIEKSFGGKAMFAQAVMPSSVSRILSEGLLSSCAGHAAIHRRSPHWRTRSRRVSKTSAALIRHRLVTNIRTTPGAVPIDALRSRLRSIQRTRPVNHHDREWFCSRARS